MVLSTRFVWGGGGDNVKLNWGCAKVHVEEREEMTWLDGEKKRRKKRSQRFIGAPVCNPRFTATAVSSRLSLVFSGLWWVWSWAETMPVPLQSPEAECRQDYLSRVRTRQLQTLSAHQPQSLLYIFCFKAGWEEMDDFGIKCVCVCVS